MKLDLLAFGAHPDDVELGCGATIAKHTELGYKTGIVDLTRGELGTRGTPELRKEEADAAAAILGVAVRLNLGFRDGFFTNDEPHKLELVKVIRELRPDIVLASAIRDRHPDHARSANLITESIFLAGLRAIQTVDGNGKPQDPWRPRRTFHYIQSMPITPDFIVDVTGYWQKKMDAIRAFGSQMYNPKSKEPETYISTSAFLEMIDARGKAFGHSIGVGYGEGFTAAGVLGVDKISDLL